MEAIEQWVGSDVCQRWFDVHPRAQGASLRGSNNASGIQALLPPLKVPGRVGRIMLESRGGDERQTALQVWALDYPVVVMNARQARNVAFLECPKGYKLPISARKQPKSMP